MDLSAIQSPATAFVAGLVTSLHCAGMCGPLACLLMPRAHEGPSFLSIAATYQTARLAIYTLLGALAGGLGLLAIDWVDRWQTTPARFLPWALVLFFLAVALRLDRILPKPAFFSRYLHRQTGRFLRLPRLAAGGLLGLATPLLPCGPLYLLLGLCLMTQSPLRGAEFALAFGLGTLPLLWLVQSGFVSWQGRLKPSHLSLLQRGLALLAATVVGARLYVFETSPGGFFCGS